MSSPGGGEEAVKVRSATQTQEEPSAVATLLVRHLPEAIPEEILSRLFSYYGASTVRQCSAGRLRNCAFVDFNDERLASQAQSQLHRLKFLGKVLSVERSGKPISKDERKEVQYSNVSAFPQASSLKDSPITGCLSQATIAKSGFASEPISARLGVDYPFPPHLEYAYPPPDGNILTNIVNALIGVPRFYTQVLHLMNKMNIPAPFRMAMPTPPLPPPVPAAPSQPPPPPPPPPPNATSVGQSHETKNLERPHFEDVDSEESEMESSEEDDAHGIRVRKRPKLEAIVGPGVDKGVAHEAVGLKPAMLVPKEIPVIKRKKPVIQFKCPSKPTQNISKDQNSDSKEETKTVGDVLEPKAYATPHEIESGKLPPEEILSRPMFKGYKAGEPDSVLYIKNLAKDFVEDDFFFIFGSLFNSLEEARSSLSIKLMKEGRMRDQAFVTFPSIDLAKNALNLVHGYVFRGKPMIIQFRRKPAAGMSKQSDPTHSTENLELERFGS
ncbi:hypothetical protein QJS10_CPB04g00650 [Acorus calamus]|uniref:RRM domain-containing protein n=1 Tax=Acorus calamus TaxID=4465 RepID=A0AAV9EYN2_ACOCL|nr:hypothetical protein QJS10_CPB04g00650 [Acorus calamus]